VARKERGWPARGKASGWLARETGWIAGHLWSKKKGETRKKEIVGIGNSQ
jgi:hypothetical protein